MTAAEVAAFGEPAAGVAARSWGRAADAASGCRGQTPSPLAQ